jgi:hypothetical protein
MTPEESDARLRKIHEEWREWCQRNPLPKFPEAIENPSDEGDAQRRTEDG